MIYSCDNGHEPIEHSETHCPLCAMRRHVKAAHEILASLPATLCSMREFRMERRLDDALLRLEAAINLAGQRTLPAEAALERVDAAIDRFAKS